MKKVRLIIIPLSRYCLSSRPMSILLPEKKSETVER